MSSHRKEEKLKRSLNGSSLQGGGDKQSWVPRVPGYQCQIWLARRFSDFIWMVDVRRGYRTDALGA